MQVQELISFSFTGERGSKLENSWKCGSPGISFGESLESLVGKQNTGKCVGSLV